MRILLWGPKAKEVAEVFSEGVWGYPSCGTFGRDETEVAEDQEKSQWWDRVYFDGSVLKKGYSQDCDENIVYVDKWAEGIFAEDIDERWYCAETGFIQATNNSGKYNRVIKSNWSCMVRELLNGIMP